MSKFSDFFHHIVSKAESAETTFVDDSTKFFTRVDSKLGPVGQSLVQLAITEAALVAAPWQEKLFTVVNAVLPKLAKLNINVTVNELVAAITVLLNDVESTLTGVEAAATKVAAGTATTAA